MSDMEAIDKKINEVANDDLDGLEDSLNHLDSVDSDELQSKAKEMIDDCSKKELKKVLTLLIGIARKSFQEY
tara:strand:- start:75 stop:290 length:216 start_codon:yes stop_codon:yes gene_type:complete